MFVYIINPIDFFEGWQKPHDAFAVRDCWEVGVKFDADDWALAWSEARSAARDLGWEGDISDGPYVTAVPQSSDRLGRFCFIIGWKQKNARTTFVASPYPLPWLESQHPGGRRNWIEVP